MIDQPRKYKKHIMVDVRTITYSDLYNMWLFSNQTLSGPTNNMYAKVVSERLKEIQKELYTRTFGVNVEELNMIKVDGEDPLKIDLGKFEDKEKCSCKSSNEECSLCK